MSTQDEAAVDCVAACPGAVRESGDCAEAGPACVDHRRMRKGINALIVIGGIVTTLVAVGMSGGMSSGGGQ